MVVVVFVSLGVVTSDISVLVPSGVLMVRVTVVRHAEEEEASVGNQTSISS